jgi:ribonuclease BN (tRNA processing enzyme)
MDQRKKTTYKNRNSCYGIKIFLCVFLYFSIPWGLISEAKIITSDSKAFSHKKSHQCQGVSLQILGSGGPEINDGLASTSYLVWINNKASILIDAGGGSSLHFEQSKAQFNDLKAILFTHLHVDHTAALPIYLKAGYFSKRTENLPIFGPHAGGGFPSMNEFISTLFDDRLSQSLYPYLSDTIYQKKSTRFLVRAYSYPKKNGIWKTSLTKTLHISAQPVHHAFIPAIAWRIDYKGCSISFTGDMNGQSHQMEILAKNSDWLIAHAAIPENSGTIARSLHMLPSMIGRIAKKAAVSHLLLSHFMNRTRFKKQVLFKEIKKEYSGFLYWGKDLEHFDLSKNHFTDET